MRLKPFILTIEIKAAMVQKSPSWGLGKSFAKVGNLLLQKTGNEDPDTIDRIGKHLMGTKAKYYTCHCTGIKAYERLKSAMGDNIDYLSTGIKMEI